MESLLSLPLPEPVAGWDGFTYINWPASALMLQSSMSISTSLGVIMSAYTWSRAQEALSQVVGLDPDPFDDTLLEYQNPSDRRSRAADNRHRNPRYRPAQMQTASSHNPF